MFLHYIHVLGFRFQTCHQTLLPSATPTNALTDGQTSNDGLMVLSYARVRKGNVRKGNTGAWYQKYAVVSDVALATEVLHLDTPYCSFSFLCVRSVITAQRNLLIDPPQDGITPLHAALRTKNADIINAVLGGIRAMDEAAKLSVFATQWVSGWVRE